MVLWPFFTLGCFSVAGSGACYFFRKLLAWLKFILSHSGRLIPVFLNFFVFRAFSSFSEKYRRRVFSPTILVMVSHVLV